MCSAADETKFMLRNAGMIAISAMILVYLGVRPAVAQSLTDVDGDGLPDSWETQVFHTDPASKDTDKDGFDDLTEIKQGFNPHGKGKLSFGDYDSDGLSDRLEIMFGTDPTNRDSDGDGYLDGQEVAAGFNPASADKQPLAKKIVIRLKAQELDQVLGGVVLASFKVSTGRAGYATPTGEYKIMNKNPRAWSNHAKLWMPWWMQFSPKGLGIHELPEWPNGRKEGEKDLGIPASGGCVRLGVGPAKAMYAWTPIGTPVSIVR